MPSAEPPEKELEAHFQTPVATGRFVWVANPLSGEVAYIDAITLEVKSVRAGRAPSELAAIGNADSTLVIDSLRPQATRLTVVNGELETKTYPLAPDMNRWTMSPAGRFAIAWTDQTRLALSPASSGFQDLTVLDLAAEKATVLSVGYRPSQVVIAEAETRAYVVTADGISVVALDGPEPRLIANVPIATDPALADQAVDVSITSDGAFAVARFTDSAMLSVIDLATRTRTELALPAAITDLDLAPGAAQALAVMRSTSRIARVPLGAPGSFSELALSVSGLGSVALASDVAIGLAYTNATATEDVEALALVPSTTTRRIRLRSFPLAAFTLPGGEHAIVLHAAKAFSLVPLAADLPAKIVSTAGDPALVVFDRAGSRGVIVTSDQRATHRAYVARFPSLATHELTLSSTPIAAGLVEGAGRAFVAEAHESGRLTFIDLETAEARTLTGFELGGRVVAGGAK